MKWQLHQRLAHPILEVSLSKKFRDNYDCTLSNVKVNWHGTTLQGSTNIHGKMSYLTTIYWGYEKVYKKKENLEARRARQIADLLVGDPEGQGPRRHSDVDGKKAAI